MSDALGWAIFGGILAVLAVVFLVVLRRERRAAERRFEKVMEELTSRLDGMMEELRSTADRTTDDERRGRILGELGGTIDLDEVLTRVLEAAGAIRSVDAALVLLPGAAGEKPIMATVGLSAEEAELHAVAGPPDGREARSMKIPYEYPVGAEIDDGDLIRHGLAVPIPAEAGPGRVHVGVQPSPGRTHSPTATAGRSRSSQSGPGRRSTTRGGSARLGSSPTSTR